MVDDDASDALSSFVTKTLAVEPCASVEFFLFSVSPVYTVYIFLYMYFVIC
jgi:hypothetical protein